MAASIRRLVTLSGLWLAAAQAPMSVPTPAPSALPTSSCADTDNGATAEFSLDCQYFAIFSTMCGYYDDDDFSSNDMCCGCGGGSTVGTDDGDGGSSTVTPMALPTVTPTPLPSPPPTPMPMTAPTVTPTALPSMPPMALPTPAPSGTLAPTPSPTPSPTTPYVKHTISYFNGFAGAGHHAAGRADVELSLWAFESDNYMSWDFSNSGSPTEVTAMPLNIGRPRYGGFGAINLYAPPYCNDDDDGNCPGDGPAGYVYPRGALISFATAPFGDGQDSAGSCSRPWNCTARGNDAFVMLTTLGNELAGDTLVLARAVPLSELAVTSEHGTQTFTPTVGGGVGIELEAYSLSFLKTPHVTGLTGVSAAALKDKVYLGLTCTAGACADEGGADYWMDPNANVSVVHLWSAVSNWTGPVTVCTAADGGWGGALGGGARLLRPVSAVVHANVSGGAWAPLATLYIELPPWGAASAQGTIALAFFLGEAACGIQDKNGAFAYGPNGAATRADSGTSWQSGVGPVALASFAPRAGTFAHVALAGNFSFGCEACAFNISSADEQDWGAAGVDALVVADVYSAGSDGGVVYLSLDLAVDGLDCADYGADEAAVFVEALSTVLGSSASVAAGDCTTVSRRRSLLQTASAASLNFAVVAAAGTTATSLATAVTAAVSSGTFATALTDAQTTLSYSGSAMSSVVATGATVQVAPSPTASPTGSAFTSLMTLSLSVVYSPSTNYTTEADVFARAFVSTFSFLSNIGEVYYTSAAPYAHDANATQMDFTCMWFVAGDVTVSPPPSSAPTALPTPLTWAPTHQPTPAPTPRPTPAPTTALPTPAPTTARPTQAPTALPMPAPTTARPTQGPTTQAPTTQSPKDSSFAPSTHRPARRALSAEDVVGMNTGF